MAPATVSGVKEGVVKTTTVLDRLLADLVSLKNPVTASAVVAFILSVTGGAAGLGLGTDELLGIVGGVGVVANVVKQLTE